MQDIGYLLAVFIAMMVVTFIERALPFVASQWLVRQKWVNALGRFLPLAIMVLLTLHATVGATQARQSWPVAELLAIATTVALQWWIRNPLLSIFLGTGLYVVLINGIIGSSLFS